MKPPPPRLPARGKRHREREADRDRGVDRIAAAPQHVEADPRSGRLLADHHAVHGDDRPGGGEVGDDRIGERRDGDKKKGEGGEAEGSQWTRLLGLPSPRVGSEPRQGDRISLRPFAWLTLAR